MPRSSSQNNPSLQPLPMQDNSAAAARCYPSKVRPVDETANPGIIAQTSADYIARKTGNESHEIAVVLGSGWSQFDSALGETITEMSAGEVPGFERSIVPGHTGTIWSVKTPLGKNILFFGARTHLYEGKGVAAVAHAVRTAAACGAKIMVLTNGAGSIKPSLKPGTPVLIADHINLTATSPVEGATFIDLTDLYSSRLRDIAKQIDPGLEEGVYVQFRGPNYETPAEVRMAQTMGGHIVGMSTALEAIAAREAGMEVLGLSLVTNLAAGVSATPLSHQEVIDAGRQAGPVIGPLLAQIVCAM